MQLEVILQQPCRIIVRVLTAYGEIFQNYCVAWSVCAAFSTNKCTAVGINEPLLQWLICCNFSVKSETAVLKSCSLNCWLLISAFRQNPQLF